MTMKSRSLLTQILIVNLLLIVAAVLLAAIAVSPDLHHAARGREGIVLGLAFFATMLGNWLVLRRRFKPLDELISAMETVDLVGSRDRASAARTDSSEVRRLSIAFDRMMSRLETQRREAGRAAIQAQERERRRIAQDLHDEVNQALTAVSLRLQASIERASPQLRRELTETKRLATQAMEELLALARQLRPAVLDDHGLLPALHSQVRDFAEQSGINASFNARGVMPQLTPEQQMVIYRVTQEGLSNVAQHAGARKVDVELSFVGRTVLRISDDGRGFAQPNASSQPNGSGQPNGFNQLNGSTHPNGSNHPNASVHLNGSGQLNGSSQLNGPSRNGGLGLLGMRERALLIGGQLTLWSAPGEGTRVELTINE